MTAKTRFVAYLRVSTDKQGANGHGIEAQRDAVKRYVASVGGRIIAPEFVEVESGKSDGNRPQLTKALARCKATAATLLVAKLDRLSRDPDFLGQLMKAEIDFVAADNPTANKLTVRILAAVAEAEREAISARTKAALGAAKARGVKLGGFRGHVVDHAMGTAAASEKAREFALGLMPLVEELEREGLSLNAIARRFNEEGVQSRRGGVWTAKAIANLKAQVGAG